MYLYQSQTPFVFHDIYDLEPSIVDVERSVVIKQHFYESTS